MRTAGELYQRTRTKMEDEDFVMKNPNLYITLAESVESGYILAESDATILSENGLDTLYYGE